MRVLVGCETSGKVRDAFQRRGHYAVSCDVLPNDSGETAYHYRGDIMRKLRAHSPGFWDLIILHPPCTALAVSGNRWYGEGMPKHRERIEAAQWTHDLWVLAWSRAHRVALENPVGVLNRFHPAMPKPQYIQPWQFGHGETKKTGLWLHNLPPLKPTNVVEGREQRVWKMGPSADRWKKRSETYTGIAEAMAEQWGTL